MRIAIVSLNLAQPNGDARNILSLAQALQLHGHEVSIYTTKYSPSIFPEIQKNLKNINVIRSSATSSSLQEYEGLIGKTISRIKKSKADSEAVNSIRGHLGAGLDLLICCNDYSYSLGRWYKKKSPKTKVVWLLHNTPYFRVPKKGYLHNFLSRCASFFEWLRVEKYISGIDLIVVNDAEHEKLIEKFGTPVVLLRIPVDFERFYEPAKVRPRSKKNLVILGIGSLSPARNFEDIIAAGSLLKAKGHGVKIILICKDFWKDESYKKFLLSFTKEKAMEGSVEFRFDGASERELKEIEKSADIFVVATHTTVWSMSVSEAMAAGLPVVISKTCSNCEILEESKNALFFEPGNIKELFSKIDFLAQSPEFYEKIARSGQEFVKHHLTLDRYMKDFISAANADYSKKDAVAGGLGLDAVRAREEE